MKGYQSLAQMLKDKSVLEVMAGYGRNVPVLKTMNPKSITLVDFNEMAINKAKEDYANDPSVKLFYNDVNRWILKDKANYEAVFAMWGICY